MVAEPTAVHAVAVTQETADSTAKPALGTLGVAMVCHVVPSHRAARAIVSPKLSLVAPTAMQSTALEQATPAKDPPRPAGIA